MLNHEVVMCQYFIIMRCLGITEGWQAGGSLSVVHYLWLYMGIMLTFLKDPSRQFRLFGYILFANVNVFWYA